MIITSNVPVHGILRCYFKKYFELHPTDAIYYGIPAYDHLLNDYSDESLPRGNRVSSMTRCGSCGSLRPVTSTKMKPSITPCSKENHDSEIRARQGGLPSKVARYLFTDRCIYILTVRATNDLAGNLLSRLNGTPALIRQGIDI